MRRYSPAHRQVGWIGLAGRTGAGFRLRHPRKPDDRGRRAQHHAGRRCGGGAQRDLAAGIDLYDKGDYVAAIRTLLTSREIWQAPLPTRVTAHKYVAFSHCLSNRPRPCKQSFSDLLQLQPDFELAAAESGHPLWRDAFRQAKREVGAAGGSVAGSSAGSARQSLAQKTR